MLQGLEAGYDVEQSLACVRRFVEIHVSEDRVADVAGPCRGQQLGRVVKAEQIHRTSLGQHSQQLGEEEPVRAPEVSYTPPPRGGNGSDRIVSRIRRSRVR